VDFFAIASRGAYPTPTPTGAQRASYVVTAGLLSLLPSLAVGGFTGSLIGSNFRRCIG